MVERKLLTHTEEMNYRGISGVFNFDKKVIKCSSRIHTTQSEHEESIQDIATKITYMLSVCYLQSQFCRKIKQLKKNAKL